MLWTYPALTNIYYSFLHILPYQWELCTQKQGCQVLRVLDFSILLLKLHFCYWNFHKILAKIPKFVLIYGLFPHKNTEICVKLCRNTENIGICYWNEFPEVGSPAKASSVVLRPGLYAASDTRISLRLLWNVLFTAMIARIFLGTDSSIFGLRFFTGPFGLFGLGNGISCPNLIFLGYSAVSAEWLMMLAMPL